MANEATNRKIDFNPQQIEQSQVVGKNFLLVIGIDEYQHVNPLKNAVRDAQAFIKVLQTRYDFEEGHTISLFDQDATRDQIYDAFEHLDEELEVGDNLIIYYAGHGELNRRGWGFWIPTDAQAGRSSSYINNRVIIDFIRDYPCQHIVLISDSCFSGAFFDKPRDLHTAFTQDSSRWAITSGRKQKVSDGQSGQGSPFSQYLIKYLENNEGPLHISELGNRVKISTNAHTEMYQTPRAEPLPIKGHEGGEFIFFPKVKKAEAEIDRLEAEEEKLATKDQLKAPKKPPTKIQNLKPKTQNPSTKGYIKMVKVEGGTFQMGSNENDSEKPIHQVTLSTFEIGKYLVTQQQWEGIMGSNPSYFKNYKDCPVERLNWKDVDEFIKKLNTRYPGMNYRLPTEAEWEFAARGGNQRASSFTYSGSNNVGEVGWYRDNSGKKTHPVGQKKPNELGLYDMSGNVWEWCEDWYTNYPSDPQNNPSGPSSGTDRVLRGGSWNRNAYSLRTAYRYINEPYRRRSVIGFRLARTP